MTPVPPFQAPRQSSTPPSIHWTPPGAASTEPMHSRTMGTLNMGMATAWHANTNHLKFSGGGALAALQKGFSEIYSDTGKRYAFEQTLCFTVPRTTQQLYRNFDLTGEVNKMAAWEMLIRDLMADFLDTFAPGLLAYYGVSKLLDKRHGTMTQRMMGQEGLAFYSDVAKNTHSLDHFYQQMNEALHQAGNPTQKAAKPNLQALVTVLRQQEADWHAQVADQPWLKRGIYKLRHRNPANASRLQMVQQLAANLGLVDFDIELKNTAGKTTSLTLPELLDDLKTIETKLSHQPATQTAHWGEHLAGVLQKTKRLSQHHMWANAVALVASLSMPFIIRKITQWVTGHDAYPGSTAIQKKLRKTSEKSHIHKHKHPGKFAAEDHPTEQFAGTEPTTKPEKNRFNWFPYMQQCIQEGKVTPLAVTAAFFGVLATAVLRNRFWGKQVVQKYGRKLNPTHWKDLVRVYQFQRGFPWTTLAQMELTYGLLCGFRLLSARNDSEWRETALRDALLGWPTLTYGFEFVQKQLGKVVNRALVGRVNRTFSHPMGGSKLANNAPLLTRSGGDIRNRDDITAGLMKNATGLSTTAAHQVTRWVNNAWTGLTLTSMAISISLLSFLEPKWGINMTTNLEMKKHQKALEKEARPILEGTQTPLSVMENNPTQANETSFTASINPVSYRQAAFSA